MKWYTLFNGNLNTRIEKYRNGRKKIYCTDIICFDIETTSAWIDENGDIIPYVPGKSAEYWNSLQPLALPYIFMLSVNDTVYFGREFTDFRKMLSTISSDVKVIIWVHNLAFEFQFLCNLFRWKTVFARTPHKVIKCVPCEFPNVEFRCTYTLTRLSLANWGKQIGVEKLVGDLDYNVLRTPRTPLTETEKGYCERDVLVMYHGLQTYLKEYGTLENIPLTQTGTVRRVVKNLLTSNIRYMYHVKNLVPKDADEYAMLQRVFAGGYTHASRLYAGRVVRGTIQHYDFASAYPFQMLARKYPNTPWVYCKPDNMPTDFEDNAYIFNLVFSQLNCIKYNTYLQASKCADFKKIKLDNGRVLSAEKVIIWCTEQDYMTLRDSYTWDNMEILHCYKSHKDYLPKDFLEYLLQLYHNKTALKGIPESEPLYLQSKQYINSLFGMMVTAILQSDVDFDGIEWEVGKLSERDVNIRLNELRDISPKETRYFLSYSWGVYVTAYCRRSLWQCILKYDNKVLYADTDSIFMLGAGDFTEYNNWVYNVVRQSCRDNDLDIQKTAPVDTKGIAHPIGIFDRENDCTEFITLGAKRYCYRDAKDNQLHLTISGINKDAVELLNDDISNFVDGFEFDKDAPCVKKKLLIYLNEMPTVKYPDGYISDYTHGIVLRNNGYKLGITDEYKNLIDYCNVQLNSFPDGELNAMRGRYSKIRGS